MKPANAKKLSELIINTNENGFTVWVVESVGGQTIKHWIIDGSVIRKDGSFQISNHPGYKTGIVRSKTNKEEFLVITKKPKK